MPNFETTSPFKIQNRCYPYALTPCELFHIFRIVSKLSLYWFFSDLFLIGNAINPKLQRWEKPKNFAECKSANVQTAETGIVVRVAQTAVKFAGRAQFAPKCHWQLEIKETKEKKKTGFKSKLEV